MIEYEDITVPATTRKQARELSCDMCGEISPAGRSSAGEGNWTDDAFDFDRIVIERSEGCSYPGGGRKTRISYDCCPECWVKICALFKSGPRTEETDW